MSPDETGERAKQRKGGRIIQKLNFNDIFKGKNLEMSFFCCTFAGKIRGISGELQRHFGGILDFIKN